MPTSQQGHCFARTAPTLQGAAPHTKHLTIQVSTGQGPSLWA
ncbi:hypothetical protein ACG0Z6_04585 [Roseateles sp. BYS180W]|uniref:Uncharacterized protein n=1 Tax=Roseateles rivi TaxID=3299028 RepID=A0ABW7FT79_9BURK